MMFQEACDRGLLAGIQARLGSAELGVLDEAFARLRVKVAGKCVDAPGQAILQSCLRELALPVVACQTFQEKLGDLLRGVCPSKTPMDLCCDYHDDLMERLRSAVVSGKDDWLATFLEVLTYLIGDQHCQLPSCPMGVSGHPERLLSRMMPLQRFVRAYTTLAYNNALLERLRKDLSSQRKKYATADTASDAARMAALGTMSGLIGFCEAGKPFATLTSRVDAYNRHGSPDRLLQALGLMFEKDIHWVELIYPADAVRRLPLPISIPTHLESAGNWAFCPDRDDPMETNFAVDLRTGGRGLPEIIHHAVEIGVLYDLVVWGEPTAGDWSEPSSPFAVS